MFGDTPPTRNKTSGIIKRPTRDAGLYMGEATPPDPHFLFPIAAQP